MNWKKHKSLYEPVNTAKLYFEAVEYWTDYQLIQQLKNINTLTKKKKKPHFVVIEGDKK